MRERHERRWLVAEVEEMKKCFCPFLENSHVDNQPYVPQLGLFVAGQTHFRLPVEVVDIHWLRIRSERVDNLLTFQSD